MQAFQVAEVFVIHIRYWYSVREFFFMEEWHMGSSSKKEDEGRPEASVNLHIILYKWCVFMFLILSRIEIDSPTLWMIIEDDSYAKHDILVCIGTVHIFDW